MSSSNETRFYSTIKELKIYLLFCTLCQRKKNIRRRLDFKLRFEVLGEFHKCYKQFYVSTVLFHFNTFPEPPPFFDPSMWLNFDLLKCSFLLKRKICWGNRSKWKKCGHFQLHKLVRILKSCPYFLFGESTRTKGRTRGVFRPRRISRREFC